MQVRLLCALLLILLSRPVYGDLLFYAGDADRFDVNPANTNIPVYTSGYEWPAAGNYYRIYNNFEVPVGQTWNVTALGNMSMFENSVANGRVIRYEIRQGITPGNGGALIAGGDATVNNATYIGNSYQGLNGAGFNYDILLPGNLALSSGTYWVTLQPYFQGLSGSFQVLTKGVNAYGAPAYTGIGYESESFNGIADNFRLIDRDYEAAVSVFGTVAAVPEPASMLGLTVALVGAGWSYRRRTKLHSSVSN